MSPGEPLRWMVTHRDPGNGPVDRTPPTGRLTASRPGPRRSALCEDADEFAHAMRGLKPPRPCQPRGRGRSDVHQTPGWLHARGITHVFTATSWEMTIPSCLHRHFRGIKGRRFTSLGTSEADRATLSTGYGRGSRETRSTPRRSGLKRVGQPWSTPLHAPGRTRCYAVRLCPDQVV
jgi:hypothetical protein